MPDSEGGHSQGVSHFYSQFSQTVSRCNMILILQLAEKLVRLFGDRTIDTACLNFKPWVAYVDIRVVNALLHLARDVLSANPQTLQRLYFLQYQHHWQSKYSANAMFVCVT